MYGGSSGKMLRSISTIGYRRSRQVGRVDADDPGGALGIPPRERPDEQTTPVVAGEHGALMAEGLDEPGQAGVHPLDVVRDCGLVGAAVAGKVNRDDVEPGFGERRELVAPRVPDLRESMAEQHQRTGALLHVVQPDPVRDRVAVARTRPGSSRRGNLPARPHRPTARDLDRGPA